MSGTVRLSEPRVEKYCERSHPRTTIGRGDPMTAGSRLGHMRNTRLLASAAVLFTAVILVGTSGTASAAPCDIYASGGAPCVAAHSTTRAMFDAYNGPLYQVRRSSDNAVQDIGLLRAGGTANAA